MVSTWTLTVIVDEFAVVIELLIGKIGFIEKLAVSEPFKVSALLLTIYEFKNPQPNEFSKIKPIVIFLNTNILFPIHVLLVVILYCHHKLN